MSPDLVEHFVGHFDPLRRAGKRTDAQAYAFSNVRGGDDQRGPDVAYGPDAVRRRQGLRQDQGGACVGRARDDGGALVVVQL